MSSCVRIWLLVLPVIFLTTAANYGSNIGDDTLFRFRELLTRRNVQVKWLSEVQRDNMYSFWLSRSNISQSMVVEPSSYTDPRDLVIDRFSEFPGHFVGFDDLVASSKVFTRLEKLAISSLHSLESGTFPTPLHKVEYGHDFLEAAELLLSSMLDSRDYGYDEVQLTRRLDLLTYLRNLVQELTLTEVEHLNLPRFDLIEFLGESGYPQSQAAYRINLGVLEHDIASRFRVNSIIYGVEHAPGNPLQRWLTTDKLGAADSHASALLVLVEYMIRVDSNWNPIATSIPKTIRTELVSLVEGGFVARQYRAYRLDTKSCSSEKLKYVRIRDESGGTPFADLPNAHNPYRSPLELSCFDCHQGSIRIIRKPSITFDDLDEKLTIENKHDYKRRDLILRLLSMR